MTLTERKNEITKKFKSFDSWEDRYRQLISYGKKLGPLDPEKKVDQILVPGCLSKVWLHHEFIDGKVIFQADSDASITKGIIGILVYVYSDTAPEEILITKPDFLSDIGITDHLSMNRRNGLSNMIKLIQAYALKYKKK